MLWDIISKSRSPILSVSYDRYHTAVPQFPSNRHLLQSKSHFYKTPKLRGIELSTYLIFCVSTKSLWNRLPITVRFQWVNAHSWVFVIVTALAYFSCCASPHRCSYSTHSHSLLKIYRAPRPVGNYSRFLSNQCWVSPLCLSHPSSPPSPSVYLYV